MTKLQALCADAKNGLRHFWTNERGATAIEYAIIAAGIAVVLVTAVSAIGTSLKSSFTSVATGLN